MKKIKYPESNDLLFEQENLDPLLIPPMIDGEEFVKPVALANQKKRPNRMTIKETLAQILNCENENGDSRAEVVLDGLVMKAERGDLRAVELIYKILNEDKDANSVDIKLPKITLNIDTNNDGIRDKE